ncbi:MAG: CBS domain-containing protein [Streptomycetaceae bacterium]|nr:CBS domain-containing protein [Streptomycetaceae bacterium]
MHHRTVADLMTHMVVRVHRGTPFKEIAELLDEHGITAVPVVDAGDQPVGIVSEADLLRKKAGARDPSDRMGPMTQQPEGRAKYEATTAEGLMSSPAVCARPEWNVVEAARVMQERGVKRLPVVDEMGKLVGIVSRSDLMRVFLRRDNAIRDEIYEDVVARTMGESSSTVHVEVKNGQVTLSGSLARKSLIPILVRLCQSVDGVVHVEEHVAYERDDNDDLGEWK